MSWATYGRRYKELVFADNPYLLGFMFDASYYLRTECAENLSQKRVKIVCAALSLPFPSDASLPDGVDADKGRAEAIARNLEQKMMNKLLLVGCDQSGTSTIFKQVYHFWYNFLFLFGTPFCLLLLLTKLKSVWN